MLQVGNWKGHPISYSMKTRKLTSPGRIVVGEAGRIVHPASGEGIYQGMRSGILASQSLQKIVCGHVDPKIALREYELGCRHAFERSFCLGKLYQTIVEWGGGEILARALI